MISKNQKVWLWVFGAMFVVPEVLFWFTPLAIMSFLNNFSSTSVKPLIYYFLDQQIFIDNLGYLFVILFLEWVGLFGLMILGIRLKKKLLSILLFIALIWVTLILSLAYAISNMGW
jgi:hypothetical protein